MDFIRLLVVIIFLFVCFVLIFFILIQSGKGGSLGILGGSASNTPFGTSTVDIVEKITWWGIVLFFLLSIISAILFAVPKKKIIIEEEKTNFEQIEEKSDQN